MRVSGLGGAFGSRLATRRTIPHGRASFRPISFADLLANLERAGGVPDLATLDAWLRRLRVDDAELAPFVRFDSVKYQRNLVARGQHYEVLVLCWVPGQRSPIHDHSGSKCAVRVLRGQATEVRFEHDATNHLRADSSENYATGAVTCSADEDMHLVANASNPPENLITLHVYSPPLSNMHLYSDDLVIPQSLSQRTPLEIPISSLASCSRIAGE